MGTLSRTAAYGAGKKTKTFRGDDVRPAYLTIASVNRYASDCAARAAGEKSTCPVPAKMVWRWCDISEIPAMIELTAHDVCSDLDKMRRQTGDERGSSPHYRQQTTFNVHSQSSDLSKTANDVMNTENHRASPKPVPFSRALGSETRVSGVSRAASRPSASKSGLHDLSEGLLVAACGSLLSGDYTHLCNSQVGREASSLSKAAPRPRKTSVTNLSQPQGTLGDLSGSHQSSRVWTPHEIIGDHVELSKTYDGIFTSRVSTGNSSEEKSERQTRHSKSQDVSGKGQTCDAGGLPGQPSAGKMASPQLGIVPVKEVGSEFWPAPRQTEVATAAAGEHRLYAQHSEPRLPLPEIQKNASLLWKKTAGPSNLDASNASLFASGVKEVVEQIARQTSAQKSTITY
jgi:hypothetical protein